MGRKLAVAAALFAAFLIFHLPVGDVFDMLAARFGFEPYDRVVAITFIVFGLATLVVAWTWPSGHRVLVGSAMTVLFVLIAVAHRVLLVTSIENIHYPQYALLLWLLRRALPTVEIAWLAATGLGMLDESYQHLALPRGTPEYFDWNDVVLNAIGAAFGVLILIMVGRIRAERSKIGSGVILLGSVAAVGLAFVIDPPVLSPFYSYTPAGRPFHKLSGAEATVVVAVLWMAVRLCIGHLHQARRQNSLSSLA